MSNKISVALCTYNGERFLRDQLDSIFQQTVPVNEIIICDDVSTDGTVDIINEYSVKHTGIIQLYQNTETLKSVKNFEKAVSLTTGDYIFLCDQDDIWMPDKVELFMKHFNENPEVEGIFTNGILVNDEGKEFCNITLWDLAMFNVKIVEKIKSFWKIYQVHQNMVTGATFCFKKNIKAYIFPFPISRFFHHDEWIALHICQRNALSYIEKPLIKYRIHANQQTGDLMLKRFEKEREFCEWSLGFKEPDSFKKYFRNYKRAYLLYEKFTDLDRAAQHPSALRIQELIDGCIDHFNEIGVKMKQKHFIQYTVKRFLDKRRNKRQIHKN